MTPRNAVTIKPLPGPVNFSLAVPGSKSLANRALLLAGVAEGISALGEIPDSDDIRAALSALSALGVVVDKPAPNRLLVHGRGLDFPVRRGDVDIRSSGTVGRFLPGLLAAATDGDWRLTATPQLARRPLSPLLDALARWGADIRPESGDEAFPLAVRGRGLSGGEVGISAKASSQFASGLLMAAPLAAKPSVVIVRDLDPDEAYIDLTLELMRRFGVEAQSIKTCDVQTIGVKAPQSYRPAKFDIEADFNSALYFLALPLLVGGTVRVVNLPAASLQPGHKFLSILTRLGAAVAAGPDGVAATGSGRPPRGGFDIDMRPMSEMALTLGVLAAFADAPIRMTNLAHIRGHETDRLASLAQLLGEVGVASELGPDWIAVTPAPRRRLKNTVIDSLDDHRLVMSFALLGLAGEGLTITNPGAVAKTFPDFFDRLALSGAEISFS